MNEKLSLRRVAKPSTMLRHFRNTEVVSILFRRKPAPLKADRPLAGAPGRARMKTYSAESGYVYQYVYRGHRDAGQTETEYVFSVTSDRKNWRLINVILDQATMDQWSSGAGRALLPVECYAIAKLALFDSFDDNSRTGATEPLRPSAEDITRYLDALGQL